MLRHIKLVWLLFRLVRRLERKGAYSHFGVSMNIVVEGEASMEERRKIAKALGQPVPDPRRAAQVFLYDDIRQPAKECRGLTFEEALGHALDEKQLGWSGLL